MGLRMYIKSHLLCILHLVPETHKVAERQKFSKSKHISQSCTISPQTNFKKNQNIFMGKKTYSTNDLYTNKTTQQPPNWIPSKQIWSPSNSFKAEM